MKPLNATVTHQLQSPPEDVFDAWLDPNLISQFMFGPRLRNETVISAVNEPHVGGRFSFLVNRGGQKINHIGEYLAVDRPHHLEFTLTTDVDPVGSRVILNFVKNKFGTEVTLTHQIQPEWVDFVDKARQAWSKIIQLLAEILAPRH